MIFESQNKNKYLYQAYKNICSLKDYTNLKNRINEQIRVTDKDENKEKINSAYHKISLLKKQSSLLDMDMPIYTNKSDVSVVITSCGRTDLLSETFKTFYNFNTYPIKEIFVIEDSGMITSNIVQKEIIKDLVPKKHISIIVNNFNIGQVKSIDKIYKQIKTKYIFHSEDDWEYYNYHFVEKSKNILEIEEKKDNILQVYLRSHKDIINFVSFHWYEKLTNSNDETYYKIKSSSGIWKGFSFNPGLKKMDDYFKISKYEAILKPSIHFEASIGTYYFNHGYESVSLEHWGYVKHLGWDDHVSQESIQEQKLEIIKKYYTSIVEKEDKISNIINQIPEIFHKTLLISNIECSKYAKKVFNKEQLLFLNILWSNKPNTISVYEEEVILLKTNILVNTSILGNEFYNYCNGIQNKRYEEICNNLTKYTIIAKYGGFYVEPYSEIENKMNEIKGMHNLYTSINFIGITNNSILGGNNINHYNKMYNEKILEILYFSEKIKVKTPNTYFDRDNEIYIHHLNMIEIKTEEIKENTLVTQDTCNNVSLLEKTCDSENIDNICIENTSVTINSIWERTIIDEILNYSLINN